MFEDYYAVIMAGGSGTRLWPLSRKDRPKQILDITGEGSLFQMAVHRLDGLFPFERILVVTVAEQAGMLQQQVPEIPLENYLIEPLPRGTASVVGLAAIALDNQHPQASMAVLTADHIMKNADHLRQLLRAAYEIAQEDYLVTLGIHPSYPATGYGYIQMGPQLGTYQGLDVHRVHKFKEKPERSQAEAFLKAGDHVWNSGMFIWKVDNVLGEIRRQMPELYKQLSIIDGNWGKTSPQKAIEKIWPEINPQTIDYGIMEGALQVAVIPSLDLGWDDVGSWNAVLEVLDGDEQGNIVMRGGSLTFDTHGTLICEDSDDRLVVTIGVDDLIIIDSGNALLVCDRKYAQRVRDVVKYLKETGRSDYL